ncbi:MAG TPA: helix-turn-helix domain-containing protein [Terrimicrobiaceae bacterium]|nr:helix-turn-helix domain-containing protein [Terrimicrobiaceae bacterium]
MGRQSSVELKDRREAVLSLLRREEAAAVIARRIGVSEPTLYRWRDEFLAAGEAALANGGGKKGADPLHRRIADLEQQIEKRDQVIGEYTIANRILKKLSGQSV